MFDRIAPRYDLANRLLSFGCDLRWRRRLARYLPSGDGLRVLDLATGTADQLLALVQAGAPVASGTGVDMAVRMLEVGRTKLERRGLSGRLRLMEGDATDLDLPDQSFQVVTMSFGIRNAQPPESALREMVRVLEPRGKALILEFSRPAAAWFRGLYLFYLRRILPVVGGWLSGDAEAYRYLNRTIEAFPSGQAFCDMMREAGFERAGAHPLMMGIATIYEGEV
jgi:demethylmenaquinone methyltransferase/2-methoxy-6-polyprenyl-1,4-benzoquinol methylase